MKPGFILCISFSLAILTAAPVRVVSLSPALTDAVVLIGGVKQLAGKSSACSAPETKNIPVAGNMGYPDVEKIIRLNVDYVISDTRHPGGRWQLLELAGIKTVFLPGEKLADFPDNLRKLGKLLKLEKQSGIAAENFETQIAQLRQSIPKDKVRALIVFAVAPAVSCSKKSFIDEALNLAGVENVCADGKRAYFVVPSEYILRQMPEVIISAGVPEKAVKDFFARQEFRHLPAVKNNRIIFIDPDKFCRAGKALPQAIKALRQEIFQQMVSPGAAVLPSK